MDSLLAADLEKLEQFAFARYADARTFVQRFHALSPVAKAHPDYQLLQKLYHWVFTPFSLWPVDVRGLGIHLLALIESGIDLDSNARLMTQLLPDPPPKNVCASVAKYEHRVKAGSYDDLIKAQHKFDSMEEDLARNPELRHDWDRIKAAFNIELYRNSKGIIRRRMVQERNFRAPDWSFSWETDAQRFQNVFDAFCHRWNLYGMEWDRPLLMKLTVNLTPHGTLLMLPRYWSIDLRRDLKWKSISRLHRIRPTRKQGAKLAANKALRRAEARRAKRLWDQATRARLKGARRDQWVMGRLGWDPRTDNRKLRRVLSLDSHPTPRRSRSPAHTRPRPSRGAVVLGKRLVGPEGFEPPTKRL